MVSRELSLLERVRKLCLAMPEAFEVEAWEHPTFRVGGGRGKIFSPRSAWPAPSPPRLRWVAEPR
jgi:hypothetical protein